MGINRQPLNDGITSKDIADAIIKHHGCVRYVAQELNLADSTLRNRIARDESLQQLLEAVRNETSIPGTGQISLGLAKPKSSLKVKKKVRQTFIITSAQNNTDLHKPFLKNLLKLVESTKAQLVVIPIRYKNVTLYQTASDYEVYWPKELEAYYLNDELKLNDNITVLGDLKIQATAVNPLDGLGAVVESKSAIIGHPSFEVKMMANSTDEITRMLATTGSCSVKNYSTSKQGYKAEKNHTVGAQIIEVIGDKFFMRQIEAEEDGSFYDLDCYYSMGDFSAGHRAAALSCGDIHADYIDRSVVSATWLDKDSIVNVCQPEHQFIHDALDSFSISHHHGKKFFLRHAKHKSGLNSLEHELNRLVDLHNEVFVTPNTTYHYMSSNHHDHLTRWLNEADPKQDLENALLFFKLSIFMLENTKQTADGITSPDPLEFAIRDRLKNKDDVIFHSRNGKVVVSAYDHSQHGDVGINGARGSLQGFSKLGLKVIVEHSHTPGRKGRAIQGGTSSVLNLEYNNGYSSWLQCHVLEYKNGKATLLPIIKGQWKG